MDLENGCAPEVQESMASGEPPKGLRRTDGTRSMVVILVCITFFALGCRFPSFLQQANSNGSADSTSNTAPATAGEPDPAAAPTSNAREDVIRASKKFLDRRSFSATMTGEGSTALSIELDYEQPDRFRMINRNGPQGMQLETIIIGRDMYMKQGERWQKLPGALGKTVPQIREMFDEKGLASLRDVTYVGEEAFDGYDSYVYTYRNEASKDGSPYPFTSKIWVRQTDGLPAAIEVNYEGGELKKMTIVYDYEKTVSIKPPVN